MAFVLFRAGNQTIKRFTTNSCWYHKVTAVTLYNASEMSTSETIVNQRPLV